MQGQESCYKTYVGSVSLQDIWLIVSRYWKGNIIQKFLRRGDKDRAFNFLMDSAKLRNLSTCKSRAGMWSSRNFSFSGTLQYLFGCFVSEHLLSIKYLSNKHTITWKYITSLQMPYTVISNASSEAIVVRQTCKASFPCSQQHLLLPL